jgi:hypothetical protein
MEIDLLSPGFAYSQLSRMPSGEDKSPAAMCLAGHPQFRSCAVHIDGADLLVPLLLRRAVASLSRSFERQCTSYLIGITAVQAGTSCLSLPAQAIPYSRHLRCTTLTTFTSP